MRRVVSDILQLLVGDNAVRDESETNSLWDDKEGSVTGRKNYAVDDISSEITTLPSQGYLSVSGPEITDEVLR